MKKTRVLGVALTLAATMAVGGAMGQNVKGGNNYVELKSSVAGVNVSATPDEFALVQLNKTYKFYAKPDAAFHPNYNSANTWGLTTGFTWTWTPTVAADVDITSPSGAEPKNYVQMSSKKVGAQKISVQENAPSSFGGCSGVASDFFLATFEVPSFDVVAAGTSNDRDKKICESSIVAATDFKFEFSLKSSGTPHVVYTYEIVEGEVKSDGSIGQKTGSTWTSASSNDITEKFTGTNWNFNQAATAGTAPTAGTTGVKLSLTTALTVPTLAGSTITGTPALADYNLVIQKKPNAVAAADPSIIIYRITMKQINGLISRNGDYDADGAATTENFYPATPAAATNKVCEVFLLKSPKTGPVYHISNNKAV